MLCVRSLRDGCHWQANAKNFWGRWSEGAANHPLPLVKGWVGGAYTCVCVRARDTAWGVRACHVTRGCVRRTFVSLGEAACSSHTEFTLGSMVRVL